MKRILVFIVLMALVSCTPFSETGTNESNSAVSKKDGEGVPSNMRNAYIDPNVDKESVTVVALPNNNEILLGKRPLEKAALAERLKDYSRLYPYYLRFAYVKAAPDVEYKVLREVLEILRRSEFSNLRLIVSQSDKPEANAVFDVLLPTALHSDEPVKPYPLYLGVRIENDGNLYLNKEPQNLDSLKKGVANVFRDRQSSGVFREGTTNVPEESVFVDPAPDVKYGEIVKVIDALKEAGAEPIAFKLDEGYNRIEVLR